MRIKAEYGDGALTPRHELEEPTPGEVYEIFPESELRRRVVAVPWLKASERSFDFWGNEEDAVYDAL
ncbi:MAG: hypothetical protein OXK77_03220 [Gemmatimonadota bacterium]|nr:hypothetical protein [Gemmatimonadota bacterium]MDE2863887.1 hypothetical protein [Gemmatimonadota bacterium]